MNQIKQQLETEAAALAIELYNLERRRKQIRQRLSELSVAQQTIKAVEQQTTAPPESDRATVDLSEKGVSDEPVQEA